MVFFYEIFFLFSKTFSLIITMSLFKGKERNHKVTKQKFNEFVLAQGRDILWFCRITTQSTAAGDELYQDTMLTLLEQLPQLEEMGNVKSYAQVLHEETIQEVRQLVQKLPEKYRLVVYLYYSADMKIAEIAERMHVSDNTVKTRLRKAKMLLKEKMEVTGYE